MPPSEPLPAAGKPPLWECPDCGRGFARANQRHSCGRYPLEHHFAGKPAGIREVFERFRGALERLGPVTVVPEKTRIAFQVRMSFAQLTPRRSWVDGHLVLARRVEDPVFRRVDSLSARNHVHHFRLMPESGIPEPLVPYLAEAYQVGEQAHLSGRIPGMVMTGGG